MQRRRTPPFRTVALVLWSLTFPAPRPGHRGEPVARIRRSTCSTGIEESAGQVERRGPGRGRPSRTPARRPWRRCRCTGRAEARAPGSLLRRPVPRRAPAGASSPRRRRRSGCPRSPRQRAASTALRVSTSHTASWNDAATPRPAPAPRRPRVPHPARDRGLEAGEGEVEAVSLEVAPRGQPAREVDATEEPVRGGAVDVRAPGNGSPSRRATLSNASPAASSIVEPSGVTSR